MILNIFFTKNNEESKKKNTMNERVYFTLYELSRRKQQGTSFLVELNCNNGRTRERGKIGFLLLSFFFELLEFLSSKERMRLFVRLREDEEEVFGGVGGREFMSILVFDGVFCEVLGLYL